MSLPFWEATQSIRLKPNERYKSYWEALMDKQYDNAYNYFTLGRETAFGTQEYVDMGLRVDSVIDANTGLKLSDDWHSFIFPTGSEPRMGERFFYMNNVWLTVNAEKYGSPTDRGVVHRCNNKLSLVDKFKNIYEEPCVIDPALKYGNIYYNNSINIPQGSISIWVQLNEYTKDIFINDKFVVGYNEVYRVKSVINYLSDTTFSSSGSHLLKIECDLQVKQAGDDFITGITGGTPIVQTKASVESIGLNPLNQTILQGDTQTFTCNSYVGDVANSNAFTFVLLANSVPVDRYKFTVIDGNKFSIQNIKKYASENLFVKCTNNTTSESQTFEFILGGGYY